MIIPICKVKKGECAHYENGFLTITRIDGTEDRRPLCDWTSDPRVELQEVGVDLDLKERESKEFEDVMASGYWTPSAAEGLGE